jgi:N4-gp56 family major capsid protein
MQNIEGVLAWVGERLAVSVRQAEDLILRDYLVSVAAEIRAAGYNNGDSPAGLGVSDFSFVNSILDTRNAMKFTTGIIAENRFGTVPIRSSYLMLTSTELEPDFDSMTGSGFTNSFAYPNGNNAASPTEFGSIYNIRILTSSQSPVARRASANSRDVFYNIVSGKQGVTHINQDGASMSLIYRDALYSGMLAQNVTLAVKFWQSQALTQPTAILKLLCTKQA